MYIFVDIHSKRRYQDDIGTLRYTIRLVKYIGSIVLKNISIEAYVGDILSFS